MDIFKEVIEDPALDEMWDEILLQNGKKSLHCWDHKILLALEHCSCIPALSDSLADGSFFWTADICPDGAQYRHSPNSQSAQEVVCHSWNEQIHEV